MADPAHEPNEGTGRREFLIEGGALAAMLFGSKSAASEADAGAEMQPADVLARLNLEFRQLYGENRAGLLETLPLAVLTLIGTGELWRIEFGKVVRSYPPIPWISKVKGLMHGVIATQATGARLASGKDAAKAAEAAKKLLASLTEARELTVKDLPAQVAPAAGKVLSALTGLAKSWTEAGKAAPNDVRKAIEPIQGELDTVLTATGEAVFESVVSGLRQCVRESDPKIWADCLVGVCGVGFARRDSIEIAACMSVLGREPVGTRVLYLENAFTIEAGMNVLAAAIADRELGRDVFGDPYRMWRDLLGDVAVRRAGGGFFPETGQPG